MTKQELIDQVSAEITASCAIPFSPPQKEIERLIDLERRWFHREYRNATQQAYYVLDKSYYDTDEWTNTRTFQMPSCVMAIRYVYELTSGQRVFGIHDPDLTFDRLMAADLYLTPLSSDQITYRTIQWSFWDLAKQFNLRDIQHGFNINTHRLIITGRDPSESLWLTTLNTIPDEDLYEDPIFIKWIIARGKMQLARIIGTFDFNLIGNIKINYADIRSEGSEELKELKELIKGQDPADWFIMIT